MNSIKEFYINLTPQIKASVVVLFIITIISVIVAIKAKKADPKAPPKGILILAEALVDGMAKFAKSIFGKRYKAYTPYLITLTLFIGGSIAVGLLGFSTPITSLWIALSLSVVNFIVIHATGIRTQGAKHFKTLIDPNPLFLPMNLIGEIAIPISMGLRLFGNLLSGALIIMLLYGVIDVLAVSAGVAGYLGLVIMPVIHAIFDIFFGYIQITVFILLTSIFVSGALPEEE